MKKHLFIIAVLTAFLGYSQSVPVTFDTGIDAESWKADSGLASVAVVADPSGGSNGNVGQMTSSAAGQLWQNAQITFGGGYNMIDLTGEDKTISFDYYSNEATGGLIKIENGNAAQNLELSFSYAAADTWETITVDFSTANAEYNKIVFFPHLGDGPAQNDTKVSYIDNVTAVVGSAIAVAGEPSTEPAAPTASESDVASLFSDTYTTSTVAYAEPSWTGASTAFDVNGNNMLKHTGSMLVLEPTGTTDVSSMTHINLDVWVENTGTLPVKLVDYGANGVWEAEGDNTEHQETVDVTGGQWNTVSLAIDDFTTDGSMAEDEHIGQIIVSLSQTSYFDNIYFSYDASYSYVAPVVNAPTVAAATPTTNALDVISIYSDSYTDIATSEWNPGWGQSTAMSEEEIASNDSIIKYESLDFTGIVTDYTNPTDLSGMTHVHFDYFTGDATGLGLKIVNTGDGQENEQAVTVTTGSWQAVDIALSDYTTGNPSLNLAGVTQLLFTGTGGGSVYIDNFYFYTDSPALAPTAGPSAPTADASDVVSLFSDSYTDVAVNEFSADWDGADVADYVAGSNNAKQYTNFSWAGIVVDNTYSGSSYVDASGMTHINLSTWSRDLSSFNLKIVDLATGTEHELAVSTTLGQWTTNSIALADFTALSSTANIGQIFLSAGSGSDTLFLDDLYFSNESAPAPAPTAVVPSAAPAVPTHAADAVLEIYSDSYENTPVTEWNPGWGQSTTQSELAFDGNSILLYENFNYQGIQLTATDLSAATHVHYDYFSPAVGGATSIGLSVINTASTNGVTESVVVETVSTQDAWVSVDTPLSSYGTEMNAVDQIKFDQGDGSVKFYIDNLIFYNDSGSTLSAGGVSEATAVSPNPTSGIINVTGDVYSVSGQKVLSNTNDLSGLPSGIYFVRANGATSKVIKK